MLALLCQYKCDWIEQESHQFKLKIKEKKENKNNFQAK